MKLVNVFLALALACTAVGATVWLTQSTEIASIQNTQLKATRTGTVPRVRKSGPQPKLVIDTTSHFFGTMAVNEIKNRVFTISNQGEGDLEVAGGEVSCKCTTFRIGTTEVVKGEFRPAIVPPGESGDVTLAWQPTEPKEEFGAQAIIWTNDAEHHMFSLAVRGHVVPKIMITPMGVWPFGVIAGEGHETFSGVIYSDLLDSFELVELASDNPHVELESRPLTPEELNKNDGKSGYQVVVRLKPSLPVGRLKSHFNFRVNSDPKIDYRMEISATKTGPVQILSPFGARWIESKGMVDLGEVSADSGKKVRLIVFLHGDAAEHSQVEISEVVCEPRFVNVQFQQDKSFHSEDRLRFFLEIDVPAGSRRGNWLADNAGSIVIQTSHPRITELRLLLSFVTL